MRRELESCMVTYHFKERLRLFLSLFFADFNLPISQLFSQLCRYSHDWSVLTLDLAGVSTATSLWNPFLLS